MTAPADGPLTAERLREVLCYDRDTGIFTWRIFRCGRALAGAVAGRITADGHIQIKIDGRSYLAHRLAWLYVTGEWPPDCLDHKNMSPNANWFDNLRPATRSQNAVNCPILGRGFSGYRGVYWDRRYSKWVARIMVNRRSLHLGTFLDKEAAAASYNEAARKHFGDYARLNEIGAASCH